MSDFLLDISPNAGNVCPTARLARRISRKGYEVCYTHTSDPLFTSLLSGEGIGRMLFPEDLRWFTPGLTLLDYRLTEHEAVYRACSMEYLFLAVRRTENTMESLHGVRMVCLTPYPCFLGPQSARCHDFMDRLAEIRQDGSQTIIIGLLEEDGGTMHDLRPFYQAIRQSGTEHPEYRFVLLTNDGRAEENLFSLPRNVDVYRYADLHALLPLCDMALTTESSQNWSECVFARVPAVTFSPKDIRQITPRKLDRRIADAANNRQVLLKRQDEVGGFYRREEQKLDELAEWLINRMKNKRNHEQIPFL